MTKYTVLYTCNRGYKCFRTVQAPDHTFAGEVCKAITYNFGELTQVRPYVGK